MNTLDIVLLVCFLPGIIRGISKGFLEQAISLVGIFVSVWAAFHFSEWACTLLKPYLEVSETVLHVIAFALILVVISIAALLVAKLLTKLFEMAMLGWLNKLLGVAAAILVTALVLGVLVILFDTINVKFSLVQEEKLSASVLYGILKDFGYFVFPYLKQLLLKQ
jgi:membrane protein required for colicin V production